MKQRFLAHVRERDGAQQTLEQHLSEVAEIAKANCSKVGLGRAGELVGLLHDLGKYSGEFQTYIQSATGLLNPDEDEEYVDAARLKGKIDHSTAGAQLAWRAYSKKGQLEQIAGQMLALCIASHHSGLIDCLGAKPATGAEDNFSRRMSKPEENSHLEEAVARAEGAIGDRIQVLLRRTQLVSDLATVMRSIILRSPDKNDRSPVAQAQIGLLVRFLFSCLIDADRQNSADFENPRAAGERSGDSYPGWDLLAARLEAHLKTLVPRHPVDALRQDIARCCLDAATRERGIFTLTVPTGGGKTLASLRFALNHAHKHGLDRVFYIIPFTSIIDQNAEVARSILEPDFAPEDRGRIVLEHHSNLGPELQDWRQKVLTENWDAPVVYTTSVQFLDAVFGAGTRGARRMHQLSKAVIVFDEIQTLPIRCVHLFNNAINFLVDHCGSTVVFCTATQPLLGRVDPSKGAARLGAESEIMPDTHGLFQTLKRVAVHDRRKPGGWTEVEITELAAKEMTRAGSCLVVVNTKKAARALYRQLSAGQQGNLFHLSTSMCPMHRKGVLKEVRARLQANHPVLCISTQLIEAGVDVDFGAVIRFVAGLDSIAQAAGRCNRNGRCATGLVHVLNPADENLNSLHDIRTGRTCAERVLDDFKQRPGDFSDDPISPKAMEWFYENYFFSRKNEMDYPVGSNTIGRDDTLLNLLAHNPLAQNDFERRHRDDPQAVLGQPYLRQSFMTAAKAFQAIDSPTQGVVVPFDAGGTEVIAKLRAEPGIDQQRALLRRAQQYTVNLFPGDFQNMLEQGFLHELREGLGVYYMMPSHYSNAFGLSTEPVDEEGPRDERKT